MGVWVDMMRAANGERGGVAHRMHGRSAWRAGLWGFFVGFAALWAAALWTTHAYAQAGPLKIIKTVVLDPGHGGANRGTQSASGTLEKDQALRIAYRVREQLQRDYPGLRVVLTRNMDVDLSLVERLTIAHEEGADLFLSLHLNAAPNTDATGIEVYYLKPDKAAPLVEGGDESWGHGFVAPDDTPDPLRARVEGDALARLFTDLRRGQAHRDSASLAEILLDELGRACPGHGARGVKQQNFGVLRGARLPAVVVEFGFLSNTREAAWLIAPETHDRFARAISKTVGRVDDLFLQNNYRNDGAPP